MTRSPVLVLLGVLLGVTGPRTITPMAQAPSATRTRTTTIERCPVFPDDNPWNQAITTRPVHPLSTQYIASINSRGRTFLHAAFGPDPSSGIPYSIVPGTQAKVPITFTEFGAESDPGPYPVPLHAPVEAGEDRRVLTIDKDHCLLYELYHAKPVGTGWEAGAGAVFDLRANTLRPLFWTSADAAGLPIFPGLVRYEEVQAGKITHALRFTVAKTQRAFILPARHFGASSSSELHLPPMGLRLRLKMRFDLTPYTGQARIVLEALKIYGMIVADTGADWFITGAADTRWNAEDLAQLQKVPGTAFDAVQTGPIVRERP